MNVFKSRAFNLNLCIGRSGIKSPSGIGTVNNVRKSRIAKQTKETRFAQRTSVEIDSRMTASVPPGADLDFSNISIWILNFVS